MKTFLIKIKTDDFLGEVNYEAIEQLLECSDFVASVELIKEVED